VHAKTRVCKYVKSSGFALTKVFCSTGVPVPNAIRPSRTDDAFSVAASAMQIEDHRACASHQIQSSIRVSREMMHVHKDMKISAADARVGDGAADFQSGARSRCVQAERRESSVDPHPTSHNDHKPCLTCKLMSERRLRRDQAKVPFSMETLPQSSAATAATSVQQLVGITRVPIVSEQRQCVDESAGTHVDV
jgi:hypothetical protein